MLPGDDEVDDGILLAAPGAALAPAELGTEDAAAPPDRVGVAIGAPEDHAPEVDPAAVIPDAVPEVFEADIDESLFISDLGTARFASTY